MKYIKRFTAGVMLACVASVSFADIGGGALDMSSGTAIFGRSDAQSIFNDTWTFDLASAGTLITGTASSAAVGNRNLDFSSLQLFQGESLLATFVGNSGNNQFEFYTLPELALNAGSYSLVVKGVNSPEQASYAGTLAVAVTPVPEPKSYAMMLLGLAGVGAFMRRRRVN